MNYSDKVREFIVENFLFGDGEQLQDDTSFLEEGIIDSTGILELIMFLEETYGLKIEDDELIPENLDNISNITHFLERKQSA
ncbi:acyl carrier protein [Planctomycetota bacterium]